MAGRSFDVRVEDNSGLSQQLPRGQWIGYRFVS
jgi:hypothetical protein